jgi:hypothetical protein
LSICFRSKRESDEEREEVGEKMEKGRRENGYRQTDFSPSPIPLPE